MYLKFLKTEKVGLWDEYYIDKGSQNKTSGKIWIQTQDIPVTTDNTLITNQSKIITKLYT